MAKKLYIPFKPDWVTEEEYAQFRHQLYSAIIADSLKIFFWELKKETGASPTDFRSPEFGWYTWYVIIYDPQKETTEVKPIRDLVLDYDKEQS